MYRSGKDRDRARALALQHPVRATLHERLRAATAPVPLEDLAQAMGVAVHKVRYHVRVLISCGLAKLDDDDRATGLASPLSLKKKSPPRQ